MQEVLGEVFQGAETGRFCQPGIAGAIRYFFFHSLNYEECVNLV